jgi:membrane protein YqaA with SNARE-associated domain
MRSNMLLTFSSMTLGKALRYAAILGLFEGIVAMF